MQFCLQLVRQRYEALVTPSRLPWETAIVAILASATCGGDRYARRGQIISPFSLADSIVTPPQFVAGVPDTVTVTTWGHGACVTKAWIEVTVIGREAIIEPFDYDVTLDPNPSALIVCNDIAPKLFHYAVVEFASPGSATITVIGLDTRRTVVQVEREVSVQ